MFETKTNSKSRILTQICSIQTIQKLKFLNIKPTIFDLSPFERFKYGSFGETIINYKLLNFNKNTNLTSNNIIRQIFSQCIQGQH